MWERHKSAHSLASASAASASMYQHQRHVSSSSSSSLLSSSSSVAGIVSRSSVGTTATRTATRTAVAAATGAAPAQLTALTSQGGGFPSGTLSPDNAPHSSPSQYSAVDAYPGRFASPELRLQTATKSARVTTTTRASSTTVSREARAQATTAVQRTSPPLVVDDIASTTTSIHSNGSASRHIRPRPRIYASPHRGAAATSSSSSSSSSRIATAAHHEATPPQPVLATPPPGADTSIASKGVTESVASWRPHPVATPRQLVPQFQASASTPLTSDALRALHEVADKVRRSYSPLLTLSLASALT